YRIKPKKPALILPAVLFVALGYLSIQPWAAPRFPTDHVIHFADSHARQIVGSIESRPVESPHRLKFTLNVENLGAGKKAFSIQGKINVSVWGISPKLSSGDRISFVGRIRLIRNFNNPGRFDYKRYMDFKKIWGTAHTQAKKLTVLKRNSAGKHFGSIETARNKISELIEKTRAGEHQGVLKALLVGDRSNVSQAMRAAFNRAGVGHLLAISGLHIGIVATVAFFCFRWLLAFIRPFLWQAWTRKGAALLTLVPVLIYGLLAGMSPSTQRAVMMVGIFLLTILLESEQDLLNTLAVAAMVILIVHPPSLFSISFQLSFCAVLFIIYGLSSLQGIYAKPMGRFQIFKKLGVFILVSFFAIIGTLPLVMRYFNQVSLVGLLTNIVFIPLIGFVVVPLGLMAVFVYPLSNPAALWCLKVGAAILNPSLNMIRLVAGLPFAAVNTLTPTKVEIVCYYGLVWTLLNLMRNRRQPANAGGNVLRPEPGTISRDNENPSATVTPHARTHAGRIYETMRRTWQRAVSKPVLLKVVMVIIALVGCVDIGYWLYYRLGHQDLRVTVMDVGQGSAALLELPGGYNLLIDGGGFSTNSTFDVGTRIVAPLLRQKKIRTVETLILSHPNSDHLNGLLYIAEHFNVKQVWSNSQASETGSYQQLKAIIAKNKIHMPEFKEIPRDHEINGVYLKILYPPGDFKAKRKNGET
ncbi:ComEC/Rec2 family competence protein, partial [Thermodesulfobacteriota bacterium]